MAFRYAPSGNLSQFDLPGFKLPLNFIPDNAESEGAGLFLNALYNNSSVKK
jgi:hypothetical protein